MNMIKDANPADTEEYPEMPAKQTVELRSPDGSADLYKLFAGLVVAIEHGLEMPDAIERASRLYINNNTGSNEGSRKRLPLESLPRSCWESADCLRAARKVFEKDSVFPEGVIDNMITKLKAYDDLGLNERLDSKQEDLSALVAKFLHCG